MNFPHYNMNSAQGSLPINGMYITSSCEQVNLVPPQSSLHYQQPNVENNTDVFICGLCHYRTNNMDLFFLHKQQPHYPVVAVTSLDAHVQNSCQQQHHSQPSTMVYLQHSPSEATSTIPKLEKHQHFSSGMDNGELLSVLDPCPPQTDFSSSHQHQHQQSCTEKYSSFSLLDDGLDLVPTTTGSYLLPGTSSLDQYASTGLMFSTDNVLIQSHNVPSNTQGYHSDITVNNTSLPPGNGNNELLEVPLSYNPPLQDQKDYENHIHQNHHEFILLDSSQVHIALNHSSDAALLNSTTVPPSLSNNLPLPPISEIKVRNPPMPHSSTSNNINVALRCSYDSGQANIFTYGSQSANMQQHTSSHSTADVMLQCASKVFKVSSSTVPNNNSLQIQTASQHTSLGNTHFSGIGNEDTVFISFSEQLLPNNTNVQQNLRENNLPQTNVDFLNDLTVQDTTPLLPVKEFITERPLGKTSVHYEPTTCQTTARLFPCKLCQKQFSQFSHLRLHMRCHGGIKPFMCILCGKIFSRHAHAKLHLSSHKVWPTPALQTRRFVKNITLEERYENLSSLALVDIRQSHSIGVDRSECQKDPQTDRKKCLSSNGHLSLCRKTIDSHYRCLLCDKVLMTYPQLRCHASQHTHQMVFPCSRAPAGCRLTFLTLEDLGQHMLEHKRSGENVYVCAKCSFETQSVEQYRVHSLQYCQHKSRKPKKSRTRQVDRDKCGEKMHPTDQTSPHPDESVLVQNLKALVQGEPNASVRRRKRSKKLWTCHWCSSMFQSRCQFILHQLIIHRRNAKPSASLIEHLTAESALRVDPLASQGPRILECPTCSRKFVRPTLYERHVVFCKQNAANKQRKQLLKGLTKQDSCHTGDLVQDENSLSQTVDSSVASDVSLPRPTITLECPNGDSQGQRRSTRQRVFTCYWEKPRVNRSRRCDQRSVEFESRSRNSSAIFNGMDESMMLIHPSEDSVADYVPFSVSYNTLFPSTNNGTSTKPSFLESLKNDSLECDTFQLCG